MWFTEEDIGAVVSAEDEEIFPQHNHAARNGIRTLYRFMEYPQDGNNPVGNAERRRRLEALLIEGELYWPTAAQFNDPFEAKPHFVPVGPDPEGTREALLRGLRERFAPQMGLSRDQIQEYERATMTVDPSEVARRLAEKWHHKFRTGFPMCCFASNREHILMWSYYAGGHSGVAVHFDATVAPFGASDEVLYRRDYPRIPFPWPDVMTADQMMSLSLYRKAEHWKHEGEYRFVNYPRDDNDPRAGSILSDIFEWQSPQLCFIPPRLLTGITLGASISTAFRHKLMEICAARNPPLPVWLAECEASSYGLVFNEVGHGLLVDLRTS
jgi:hypothetical protein